MQYEERQSTNAEHEMKDLLDGQDVERKVMIGGREVIKKKAVSGKRNVSAKAADEDPLS